MFRILIACAALLLLAAAPARAGETLREIRSRAALRCGVSEGITGFSARDGSGRWVGFDADFCRAVAAAALGDPERVEFVPLRASARFPALLARRIDLLVRDTTWTLEREAGLEVAFAGILFFDGQGFLVPASSGVASAEQLGGATVCVEQGTTHGPHLADWSAARGLRVDLLAIDSAAGVAEAFFAGRCVAYTGDAAQLAAARLRAPAPADFVILPERISKEPFAPVVRRGDEDWLTLVRWVLFTLLLAEEHGVTQEIARTADAAQASLGVRRGLETGNLVAAAIGVEPDWAVRVVRAVGNYGEMFERNLGRGSPLGLERGANRLWNQGGLMYAPPMR